MHKCIKLKKIMQLTTFAVPLNSSQICNHASFFCCVQTASCFLFSIIFVRSSTSRNSNSSSSGQKFSLRGRFALLLGTDITAYCTKQTEKRMKLCQSQSNLCGARKQTKIKVRLAPTYCQIAIKSLSDCCQKSNSQGYFKSGSSR